MTLAKSSVCIACLICLQGAVASSAICGDWQDAYTKLHREILIGKRPPRYAVSVAIEAGKERASSGVSVSVQSILALLSAN